MRVIPPSRFRPTPETLLGILFLAGMTVGVFWPLAFAVLPIVIGFLGSFIFYRKEGRLPAVDHTILRCVLAVCGLLYLGSLWSLDPAVSVARANKVAPILLLSLPLLFLAGELPVRSLEVIRRSAIFPLIAASVLFFVELKFGFPLYHALRGLPAGETVSRAELNKHMGVLMMLTPFCLGAAYRVRRYSLVLLFILASGAALSATESQAAQLSAAVTLLSIPAVLLMPKAAPRLMFGGAAFLLLFMPWISPIAFDAFADVLSHKGGSLVSQANSSMRLENWDFISRRIMENPATGFGTDITRTMVFDTDKLYFPKDMILHPHNAALQIWIEFGAVGASLALVLMSVFYRRMSALRLTRRIIPFATFASVFIFLMVSWSLWASWLDGVMMWAAALSIGATRPTSDREPS